jgi:putative transposase
LEAIKEEKTSSELSSTYKVHPGQIRNWKLTVKNRVVDLFSNHKNKKEKDQQELIEELYRQIGQLKVELDWLKKNLSFSHKEKLLLIDKNSKGISVRRQAELLGISRSSIYYKPIVDSYNLSLMQLIDEQYTKTPFYGSRKMTEYLKKIGHKINRKRVQKLMQAMGLEAIYPKRNLSKAKHEHKIYPYLLRGLKIDRPNQVWGADITYIRLSHGFVYLIGIMDWFSRFVVSWEISTTLDASFCLDALDTAFIKCRPEIFNTDQGAQFTSSAFINKLKNSNIQISMDGRGRVFDNIFTERLWRSLKYEEVYLKDYQSVLDSKLNIGKYLELYNYERLHQALNYKTPDEVYFQRTNHS